MRTGATVRKSRKDGASPMKKFVSVVLALALSVTMLCGLALADGNDTSRIVFGKDLTDKQKADLLVYFGVKEGDVKTLTVTHEEETAWLGALISADKLGTHSLSSIYIKSTAEGSGLNVETKNINWVTPEMYMAALTTAGIVDADIKIAAPIKVSGTAALAGVFKAYEDITGVVLSTDAKEVAAQELALTGQLGDALGSADATELVNKLKTMLDQIKGKSDDEIKAMILQAAKDYNVKLTDGQVTQLITLLKRLSQLNIDPALLQAELQQLKTISDKLDGLQSTTSGISGWFSSLWGNITSWLKGIFG
jgi:uncharacterized protein YpuA (DUF1002 family)